MYKRKTATLQLTANEKYIWSTLADEIGVRDFTDLALIAVKRWYNEIFDNVPAEMEVTEQ